MRTEINSEAAGPLNELSDDTEITRSQFEDLLAKIDKGLRALPATAQVTTKPGISTSNNSFLCGLSLPSFFCFAMYFGKFFFGQFSSCEILLYVESCCTAESHLLLLSF